MGLEPDEILNAWEEDRSYWYMNYYQEANQPEIKVDNVRAFDTVEDLLKSVGDTKFRCPSCEGISSDPYSCNSEIKIDGEECTWKVDGLFRGFRERRVCLCERRSENGEYTMPIAWEQFKDKGDKK